MRVAKPNELKSHAFPILTAQVSESELEKWFPVRFQQITDPQEAPEPSKAALIKLDAGDYFVLYYGEISKQLMLRIPEASDASAFLSALFREVPLPRTRILWRREDARLPRHIAAKVYFGNLPKDIDDAKLSEIVKPFGAATFAEVVKDRVTGASKGLAIVEFASDDEAHAAISALNGTNMNGQAVVVNEAKSKNQVTVPAAGRRSK